MNRRAVRILVAAVVVIVAITAVLLGRGSHGKTDAAATGADSAPAVQTARANFGPFVVRVQAEGRIGAPAGGQAKLAFVGSGVISRIDVSVGQTVAAGQTLAELDTSGLAIDAASARADAAAASAAYAGGTVPRTALSSAQARLAAAQAKLRAAQNHAGTANSDASAATAALRQAEGKVVADQRAVDRTQQTYAAGVSALKDVEAARAQLRSDEADVAATRSRASSAAAAIGGANTQAQADYKQAVTDVKNAEAQVSITGAQADSAQQKYAQAERALANAALRAPQAGVVGQILKHVGETVDPTQPVISIGPPSDRVVTLTVSGSDGQRVRVGDPVKVVDPTHNTSASGTVVAVVPSVDASTQTTTVVASAVPQGGAPGDAVTATVDVATQRGVIVPATAVVTDPQSGKTLVFVRGKDKNGDSKFAPREVTVSASDEKRALVQTGLHNGETVATQGAFDLLAPGGGG